MCESVSCLAPFFLQLDTAKYGAVLLPCSQVMWRLSGLPRASRTDLRPLLNSRFLLGDSILPTGVVHVFNITHLFYDNNMT